MEAADKRGNEGADKAADLGATVSQQRVQRFGALYSNRHKMYRGIMCRIQNFLVGLAVEDKKMRDEVKKRCDPFENPGGKNTYSGALKIPDAGGVETGGGRWGYDQGLG